jgi:hypothetical protein
MIALEDVTKVYRMGDMEVHALRRQNASSSFATA